MNWFIIEKKLEFYASPKKVFDALTKNVSKWWKREYLIGGENAKKLVCEAKLGGKMFEVWGENEGSIWGTITEIRKNVRLEICGTTGNNGATWGKIGYDFEPCGKNATTLVFSHHAIGTFEEGTGDEYDAGWDQIFSALKVYVEPQSSEKKKKKG